MATSSNAVSTAATAIFNGNSRYAADFQNVITRATAIASLPISLLTRDKATLTDQATAITTLDTSFKALQTAVQSIQDALGGSSMEATVSAPTKVSVTVGDGAVENNYSIEVTDAGAYATSMTAAGWAGDSSTHTYQLSLGGKIYSLQPANNSSASVASAINTQYGDKVHAAVVNVGSTSSPDYRISLQSTTLGDLQPDILDGSSSLQMQQTTGAESQYIVNGSGTSVTSNSRSVTIADGVTISLLASYPGNPINITITRSSSALSSALSTFATAYNTVVDAVDAQHGQSTSALAGNSVVNDLSQILSQLTTYSASSSGISGLAGLGMDLDKTGHLTFSSLSLMAADIMNPSGVAAFLGNSTTGGFLKSATDLLNRVEATGTGLLPMAQAGAQSQITSIVNSIADQQTRVDAMTAQLQNQMAAADALIASMEQQYNYLSGMFQAMQTASAQYK